MAEPLVRYRSTDEDSGRWARFPFRTGDIVISTRSKAGTTWMQMICALLVFQHPRLPAPLPELSPWLDWLVEPLDDVVARLEAQRHRRFIKTHTPLDGVPLDSRATYIVVCRHPLDAAVSLYHQGDNLDRERIHALTGQPGSAKPRPPRPSLHEWLVSWIDDRADPRAALDSLDGVLHHVRDAWARRDDDNVVLVHYADLSRDLAGQMRRLARLLHLPVPADRWAELVTAASFERMRERAAVLAPDPSGVLKDRQAFFRSGATRAGRDVLSPGELRRYERRVAELASRDTVRWLHHGSTAG
jgi:hypothetical protein